MVIEYLGSHLTNCSTINYLDNGYVYYGSRLGDSYLLMLLSENSDDKNRPYYQIVQTYPNIGLVQDLSLRNNSLEKG